VATDLEQRRLAIAEVLRKINAEPLPTLGTTTARPRPPGTRLTLREALRPDPADDDGAIDEVEPDTAEAEHVTEPAIPSLAAHAEDLDDAEQVNESPAVPPVDNVGSMSRVASLALFGHA
jgi:hypothetical protein